DNKDKMSDSRRCLDDRKPEGFRGQAALQQLMPLGDGVIVAISHDWRNCPTVAKLRAVVLECWRNQHVDAVVDTPQQIGGLYVQIDAFVLRRVRFAVVWLAKTKPNVLER